MKLFQKIHPAWLVLVACCFLQMGCTGILYNCAGIFFPAVCTELGFGMGELSFYMTLRGVFMMLFSPLAGRMLLHRNIRVLLSVCAIGGALSMASMAFFTRPFQWYIAGGFLGVFGSFIFTLPAPIIIGNWFAKKSGFATGIAMACSGLGGAVMNPIGSYIIQQWGWRVAYLALPCVCLLLVLPFTLFVMRFSPADIGVLPYGAEAANEDVSRVTAVENGARFSFRSPIFLLVVLLGAGMAFSMSFCQHFPSYAMSLGWSAGIGATMTSMSMIGNIGGKLGMGWLGDRIGIKRSTLLGLGLVALSFLALIASANTPIFALGAALVAGMSMSLYSVSVPLVVRSVYGSRSFGIVFAYVSTSITLMGSAGTSIIGYLYDVFGTYQVAFLIGAVICAIAIAALFGIFHLVEKSSPSAVSV